ncbi:MAG: cytochrome c [Pseudomonadota bacterium]|nr:cytochrome c [Pseudomonadota bacterium]
MLRKKLFSALALSFCLFGAAFAGGHSGGGDKNPAAEYRHDVMETLGANMAALVKVLTGRVDAPENLRVHANTLAETSSIVASLFPPGSEGGDALKIAWQEADKVTEASEASANATAVLAEAAANGDRKAITQAFRGVGDSCKGCHERYRKED